MKRIEVKLSLTVVAPLLDVIKGLTADLRSRLAAPQDMAELDPDFAESWATELLDGQREDFAVFLGLFGDEFFAEGVIALDAENAEPVLRSCAAVRLRLRERFLKNLGDEALETSEVDLEKLEEPVRKAFLCYLFLATLQELIIQHLDPSASEG